MPILLQSFDQISLPVSDHPTLHRPRVMRLKSLNVDTETKMLTVSWRLQTLDINSQNTRELQVDRLQKAENEDIYLPGTNELITQSEYNARYITFEDELDGNGNPTGNQIIVQDISPAAYGEYDYWWQLACTSPVPMHLLLLDAGQRFATRLGLI